MLVYNVHYELESEVMTRACFTNMCKMLQCVYVQLLYELVYHFVVPCSVHVRSTSRLSSSLQTLPMPTVSKNTP